MLEGFMSARPDSIQKIGTFMKKIISDTSAKV
jgi:hypothetical protein